MVSENFDFTVATKTQTAFKDSPRTPASLSAQNEGTVKERAQDGNKSEKGKFWC